MSDPFLSPPAFWADLLRSAMAPRTLTLRSPNIEHGSSSLPGTETSFQPVSAVGFCVIIRSHATRSFSNAFFPSLIPVKTSFMSFISPRIATNPGPNSLLHRKVLLAQSQCILYAHILEQIQATKRTGSLTFLLIRILTSCQQHLYKLHHVHQSSFRFMTQHHV